METARARIIQFIEKQKIEPKKFLETTGLKKGFVDKSHINSSASDVYLSKILNSYPELSAEWLLTGKGDMLKSENSQIINEDRESYNEKEHLIPLFEDVPVKHRVYETLDIDAVQWVDAGNWFYGITAAMRYSGESMCEYPNKCILTLKEITDYEQIVWGENYCIETSEFRIVKRIQKAKQKENIIAYSSNPKTYPDGQLIYEPINIPQKNIQKLYKVLGYIVK